MNIFNCALPAFFFFFFGIFSGFLIFAENEADLTERGTI